MRRTLLAALALALLLAGCGRTPAQSPEAPEDGAPEAEAPAENALTERDVLNLYAAASAVYDWFTMTTLPLGYADTREADGLTYCRVKAEDLSLPIAAVAEPTDSALHWQPQPVSVASLADLRSVTESYFSPEVADGLFALSPEHYRDFDGVLYAANAARGSNIYLLGKAVTPEQVDENHWTVTVTFYADSYEWERPSVTIGYSQAVLDLEHTADGWKFTSFAPSDGLDLEAETVFQFTYDPYALLEEEPGMDTWSDLKLACWLLHADGAYSEGATDYLTRRFLEDPGAWFAALSVFPDSPWEHADTVMAAPVNDTYAWYGEEEQARLTEILDTYEPRNEQEQALLDILRAAQREAAG